MGTSIREWSNRFELIGIGWWVGKHGFPTSLSRPFLNPFRILLFSLFKSFVSPFNFSHFPFYVISRPFSSLANSAVFLISVIPFPFLRQFLCLSFHVPSVPFRIQLFFSSTSFHFLSTSSHFLSTSFPAPSVPF